MAYDWIGDIWCRIRRKLSSPFIFDVTAAADFNLDTDNTVLGAGVAGIDLGVASLGGAMTYDMDAEVFGYETVATTGGLTAYLNGDDTTTSKISDEQLFYCNQRGLNQEEAVSLIVNGFCKEVLQQLPMEFAVEAQKLVGISLEGSVG